MGFQVNNNPVPIVPIKIGDEALTLLFNQLLFDDGIFAGVAVSPVVPDAQRHDPHQLHLFPHRWKSWTRSWLYLPQSSAQSLGIIPQ